MREAAHHVMPVALYVGGEEINKSIVLLVARTMSKLDVMLNLPCIFMFSNFAMWEAEFFGAVATQPIGLVKDLLFACFPVLPLFL